MRFRIIAVTLVLALAAWLPGAGQPATTQTTPQPPATQDSGKDATKPSCCCSPENHNADFPTAQNYDHQAAACCQGPDSKKMSGCSQDVKSSQGAMNCCKDKDAKLRAGKDGKPCCDAKDGKSSCGKEAAARNTKTGKDCCTDKDESCCKHVTA